MDIQYKLIKNFGPSVFAAKIPEDIINKLNNYVDQIVEDQKKSKQQKILAFVPRHRDTRNLVVSRSRTPANQFT